MTSQARRFAAPVFLFLCLLLGGSAQGAWGNAILRLIALGLIVWATLHERGESFSPVAKRLLWLTAAAIAYGILQLVPLPFAIWSSLPGRESIATGFELLGILPGPMPLSLAPYDTMATLLSLLPPLGILMPILAFRETSRSWLAVALIAATIAGVLLGILQVSSANPAASPWYIYRLSNFGIATGFFANGNHMASLLLVSIPFIAALGASIREDSDDERKRSALVAIFSGATLAVIVGLLLNGSLAGYGLGIPVIIASLAMLLGSRSPLLSRAPIAAAASVMAALILIWTSPASFQLGEAESSVTTRHQIFRQSIELAAEQAPFGSGVGTFEQVYRASENPDRVDRFYVNHAHNDYLELAVETGIAGIALMLLFLAWWVSCVSRVLRSPLADNFAMAGAIASAAILLHSLVDFPLRTAAIGTVFAMCLGLMITPGRVISREGEMRPVRHLVID